MRTCHRCSKPLKELATSCQKCGANNPIDSVANDSLSLPPDVSHSNPAEFYCWLFRCQRKDLESAGYKSMINRFMQMSMDDHNALIACREDGMSWRGETPLELLRLCNMMLENRKQPEESQAEHKARMKKMLQEVISKITTIGVPKKASANIPESVEPTTTDFEGWSVSTKEESKELIKNYMDSR